MPPPDTPMPDQRIILEHGPRTPEWERFAALILRKLVEEHAARQSAS